ncbi:hypothetical protein FACS189419_00750 [Planctomycetales bacterium]|nr:hypothetical protein FACS189419_00750 [Planctomycetales bacterium]
MSDNQANQSSRNKEGGQRFNAQNIPVGEGAKKERAEFAPGTFASPQDAPAKTVGSPSPKHEGKKTSANRRVLAPIDKAFEIQRLIAMLVFIVPLCVWASLPAWGEITSAWYNTLDYGHGFLVIPAVIFFLYVRLDTYPGTRYTPDWLGLFPLVIYAVMRYVAGIQLFDAIEQTSIFFWILSVVWFFYGTRVFFWALPSLCFLVFMFQLPFRYEVLMRNHLQAFAAQFATVLLQIAGEAAIPIKNTIRLSTIELSVEQACSGLRFLISVFAVAFATVLLFRRPWWQNIFIVAIALPLALFVNAARIALTGILLLHYPSFVEWLTKEGQSSSVAADEFSGFVFIAVALIIFGIFVWYLNKVFKRVTI